MGRSRGIYTTSSGHVVAYHLGSTASQRSTSLRSHSGPLSCALGPLSYQLSKHIASLISPLAGKRDSHVKNSKHFMEVMVGFSIEEEEMLVSFDVTSFFTNVSIDEEVQVIRDKLQGDEALVDRTTLSPDRVAELLEACLRSTYFSY